MSAPREQSLLHWLTTLPGVDARSLRSASADASARRYWRVDSEAGSRIVMDAPPPFDCAPFVRIAASIREAGLHGPEVLARDESLGFLLLTDLGDEPYLASLRAAVAEGRAGRADALMRDAIAALVQWQLRLSPSPLPDYDDTLLRHELELFPQWCVQGELGVVWTSAQQLHWEQACERLLASALAQPHVAVHRDWMPRNLMVCRPNPGILDFQDAVHGPISYDIASLLRDAFISWDEAQELDWAVRYWQQARAADLPVADDFGEFWRGLEWMGLQRHLKVMGIFCRLKLRDGKPSYRDDLPRFFAYALRVCHRYSALAELGRLLEPLAGIERRAGDTF